MIIIMMYFNQFKSCISLWCGHARLVIEKIKKIKINELSYFFQK